MLRTSAGNTWIALTGVAMCGLSGGGCGRAPNPDATIKRAYNWYVETLRNAQDPWQRARTDLQALVTERFLASIENMRPDFDGSGLVDGRNIDARLAVNDVAVNGRAATAHVVVAGRAIGRQRLNVYLVQENGKWKIDDVKLIDTE